MQAHARELAALHQQLQDLPRHLPGLPAQLEQAKADLQAYQTQVATVARLQAELNSTWLEVEGLKQRMSAMRDDEPRWLEWQVHRMRRREAQERLRVQLQSAKREIEALRQPTAAAVQLQRGLQALWAQRLTMQVGHGGLDITCRLRN